MAKQNPQGGGVSEAVAAELHELTVNLMITQIRQMMLTGEFDNAAVRNALTYLKQQNISIDAEVDPGTLNLMSALRELDLESL